MLKKVVARASCPFDLFCFSGRTGGTPVPLSRNHWNSIVSALKPRQSSSAYRTPCVQPKRVINMPPTSGPSIIGTRRTSDCTPMPIVC